MPQAPAPRRRFEPVLLLALIPIGFAFINLRIPGRSIEEPQYVAPSGVRDVCPSCHGLKVIGVEKNRNVACTRCGGRGCQECGGVGRHDEKYWETSDCPACKGR